MLGCVGGCRYAERDEGGDQADVLANKVRKTNQVSTKIVLLVVGCLGVVSCWLEGFLKTLGFWMCW